MTCRVLSDTLVVCGPSESQRIRTTETVVKWCFGCRKYIMHRMWLIDMPWYDIESYWKCERCNESRTQFGS